MREPALPNRQKNSEAPPGTEAWGIFSKYTPSEKASSPGSFIPEFGDSGKSETSLKSGFTLIEVLVVTALIALVSLPLIITYRSTRNNHALVTSAEELANTLRTAHVFARESKDALTWGVKRHDQYSYSLVSGTEFAHSADSNLALENGIIFVDDFFIWFHKGSGEAFEDNNVRLQSPSGRMVEVRVFKSGVIEISNL